MKILSMTATFGKLENQTLTLQPGLNVIHAPNEWGKSTWCAFLIAMLYGIDTKERSTKDSLAVKERYKPWSGAEMSGRMDILWGDRAITIERSSKGRVPMGQFRAYETATGLDVPELTGDTCGQVLLGVEKSVFTRAGFLRLTDMPVTQDDALRRRLNALVTTGDESGAADTLMQKLKDLKNRCRHNKTGEIPKAETQRETLEEKLSQLQNLQVQAQRIVQRQEAVKAQAAQLENHLAALAYAASLENAQRVTQAEAACQEAKAHRDALAEACKDLPEEGLVQAQLQELEQLTAQSDAILQEEAPEEIPVPETPAIFRGLSPEAACQQAKSDYAAYQMLCKPVTPILLILSVLLLVAGLVLLFFHLPAAVTLLVAGVALLLVYFRNKAAQKQERQALIDKYCGVDSTLWVAQAVDYQQKYNQYLQESQVQQALAKRLATRKDDVNTKLIGLLGNRSVAEANARFRQILSQYQALAQAEQHYTQAKTRAQELSALVAQVAPPDAPDSLTLSQEETRSMLAELQAEAHQLHRNLGLCQGQMETLGQEDALRRELAQVNTRLSRLADYENAIILALSTLEKATTELQRRFAPQISGRAQALFSRLTGGRYDRLQLTQDLSLQAGAIGENTLQEALWRSEGTVDQLYLSLRLAVAEALTPQAPLVLDDALVRFDDARLAQAMGLLQEQAERCQVILFTCQEREEKFR